MKNRLLQFFLFIALLLPAASAQACSVCFGAPGSANVKAASGAILFLLAVLIVVLSSFLYFMGYIVWRAKHPLTEESETHS